MYQKTYSSDCIGKKRKKNNGELPKYLISNNHTPIISREVFKLAQSERAKRNAKRKKGYSGVTELGKYSSKYALTDVLVCGECGSNCRRITKSYKDKKFIYWKCINRLENGSKFCNKSVGIREEVLHAAICKAIARIAPSSAEVFNSIETTLEYAITKDDVVLNKYNIELNIKQLQDEAEDYMMKAACTEGDKSRYLDEVEKIFTKVKVLREQLEVLEASVQSMEANNYEKNKISQLLQNQGFEITEYDDMLVRRLIECIKIMSDKTIVVIFKGGFEVTESLQE